MATNPKISIVGAGPGSPEYVIPIARRAVQDADIVIGADRTLILFADDIKAEARKLTAKNMRETLRQAVELVYEGKNVVILSTGDPGFSGLLKTFSKIVDTRNIEINVIPGISSVQVCAARLGIAWDNVELFTFHEGAKATEKERLAKSVTEDRTVMLLPDAKDFSPADVAKFLLNHGIDENTQVFVCENLTLNNERIVESTLKDASKADFGSLCVMAIVPKEAKG
ncbi:MAG TPA: precorrin-6y C5,15-methyltransferase (decarboxylating) subunit CbiE [Candidatus Sulfotelmatobacter sp.]|nr:precorrin-6y C5,15-methyltransferase (decarboxylating) subunit CbiE [Candidatus Sulfotelmatobacter sp.]